MHTIQSFLLVLLLSTAELRTSESEGSESFPQNKTFLGVVLVVASRKKGTLSPSVVSVYQPLHSFY